MRLSFKHAISLSSLAIFWFFYTSFFFNIYYIILDSSPYEGDIITLYLCWKFLEETVFTKVLLTFLPDYIFAISTLFEAYLFLLLIFFCFELTLHSIFLLCFYSVTHR